MNPEAGLDVIVVLGADNHPDGRLTSMAAVRAEAALDLYRRTPGAKLLVSGGFGDHFNRAAEPHAAYLSRHLRAAGVPESAFLPPALSAHTVDDGRLVREILAPLAVRSLQVVTSRFHLRRARYVFAHFFPGRPIAFTAAPNALSWREWWRRAAHERQALATMRRQGGVMAEGRLIPTPRAGDKK
jgi:uncharacterized SAM-binding protein YcdF (DUF218 family)